MLGNTWEWCEDLWYDNYPGIPQNGEFKECKRVIRGGSYHTNPHCARRVGGYPDYSSWDLGFRVAKSIFR